MAGRGERSVERIDGEELLANGSFEGHGRA